MKQLSFDNPTETDRNYIYTTANVLFIFIIIIFLNLFINEERKIEFVFVGNCGLRFVYVGDCLIHGFLTTGYIACCMMYGLGPS